MSKGGRHRERYLTISGAKQAEYGATVTFQNHAGATLTLHRTGPITSTVRDLCNAALEVDPSYLVVCISTPNTIYGDLQGRPIWGDNAICPERATLARAGRREMAHPNLMRTNSR